MNQNRAFKRDQKPLQLKEPLYRKLAAAFIAVGEDAAILAYHTNLGKSEVKSILKDPGFHKFIAKVKSNPLEVIPDESELYSLMWMEVKRAKSSRDRQNALKMLLDARLKTDIGSLIGEYNLERPEEDDELVKTNVG